MYIKTVLALLIIFGATVSSDTIAKIEHVSYAKHCLKCKKKITFFPSPDEVERQQQAVAQYHACADETVDPLGKALQKVSQLAQFDASLKGRAGKYGIETCIADLSGLQPYQNLGEVSAAVAAGELVPIKGKPVLAKKHKGPLPFVRFWVRDYMDGLASDFDSWKRSVIGKRFHKFFLPFTSFLRPVDRQQELVRKGLSIADCRIEELCSTHTRGTSFDLAKISNQNVLKWLHQRLLEDQSQGRIMVTSEGTPYHGHYHVTVFKPPEVRSTE